MQANYLDNGKLPFASLLIGRGDDIALSWNSGVAEDAIFRIASMTKPVTAVAAIASTPPRAANEYRLRVMSRTPALDRNPGGTTARRV